MAPWRRRITIDVGPGLFASRVQQTIVCQRHHGALWILRHFKRHPKCHQPVQMRRPALGVSPSLRFIRLRAIRVHQVAEHIFHRIVVTHGLLDLGTTAKIELRRRQFSRAAALGCGLKHSNRGAVISRFNGRTGTRTAKTDDQHIFRVCPVFNVTFQHWRKRHDALPRFYI